MTPVQMMISSRWGRIRWTVRSETTSRDALPRTFFDGPPARAGWISPSAIDWNRSTRYRSSSRPRSSKWVRKVCALPRGSLIACIVPSPVDWWLRAAETPSPGIRPPPRSRPGSPSPRRDARRGTAARVRRVAGRKLARARNQLPGRWRADGVDAPSRRHRSVARWWCCLPP